MLNIFFKYRWYRELVGGIWWLVEDPEGDIAWTNRSPNSFKKILNTQDYTKESYQVFPELEFYRAIANIPRNGEWKDDLNLSKYLKTARILRQRGLDDSLIIEMLDNCYRAASMEQTTSLPAKYYDWGQLQEVLERSQDLGRG